MSKLSREPNLLSTKQTMSYDWQNSSKSGWSSFERSKKEGNGQESIQSSTTPDPGYQWERPHTLVQTNLIDNVLSGMEYVCSFDIVTFNFMSFEVFTSFDVSRL